MKTVTFKEDFSHYSVGNTVTLDDNFADQVLQAKKAVLFVEEKKAEAVEAQQTEEKPKTNKK